MALSPHPIPICPSFRLCRRSIRPVQTPSSPPQRTPEFRIQVSIQSDSSTHSRLTCCAFRYGRLCHFDLRTAVIRSPLSVSTPDIAIPLDESVSRSVMPNAVYANWLPEQVHVKSSPGPKLPVPSDLIAVSNDFSKVNIQVPTTFRQSFGDGAATEGPLLGRDFLCFAGGCSTSAPPEIDFSVLPIVPPVEPACPKASDPLAKNMKMVRRGFIASALIRHVFSGLLLSMPRMRPAKMCDTSGSEEF